MPFDDPRELANGYLAAARNPQPEVTYGPMGERYEVEQYRPPTVAGVDPLRFIANRTPAGMATQGVLSDFMLGRALSRARANAARGDSVDDVLRANPQLAHGFRQSLGPYDRMMEMLSRRPQGWPLLAAPGHLAAQGAWVGGTTYLADRAGIWDPIKDAFRSTPASNGPSGGVGNTPY